MAKINSLILIKMLIIWYIRCTYSKVHQNLHYS